MSNENQITVKLCISRIHSNEAARIRISQSSLNDLTEGDFVFMVVDMMKNSGWYGQADYILEFVGVNVGLDNESTTMSDVFASSSTTTTTTIFPNQTETIKRKRNE